MIVSQLKLLSLLELLGVLAFAFTGIIEARKKGMDLIGVYTVSMMSAFGGGTIRDLILGHHPLYWVHHSAYSLLLLGFAIIAAPLSSSFYENTLVTKVFVALDVLGLGLFSAVGASIAHQAGCDFYISIILGVVTGVFGGVIRDILCNEIPNIFRRNELYATCAALGSLIFLILIDFGVNEITSTLISIFCTVSLRMFSVKYRVKLPF